jgi:hypothetical protein
VSGDDDGNRMPSAMEATEGVAPELVSHSDDTAGRPEELSPEERAISGLRGDVDPDAEPDEDRKEFADEDAETAALAEGRAEPPANTRDEP